jgi:AcrR family transcriptional regulator
VIAKTSPADDRELRTQGKRTMAKLLDAGMQVLADKGYHAARVDDIVRAADVSHGTFYLYFSNKQDLLRAMAGRCADEMVAVVTSLDEVGPGAAGQATLRSWLDDFLENYRLHDQPRPRCQRRRGPRRAGDHGAPRLLRRLTRRPPSGANLPSGCYTPICRPPISEPKIWLLSAGPILAASQRSGSLPALTDGPIFQGR